MAYIRRYYGVPAKRGGRVRPKVGGFMAGRVGRILRAHGSYLVVRDAEPGPRKAWQGHFHPNDLDYLPSPQEDGAGQDKGGS